MAVKIQLPAIAPQFFLAQLLSMDDKPQKIESIVQTLKEIEGLLDSLATEQPLSPDDSQYIATKAAETLKLLKRIEMHLPAESETSIRTHLEAILVQVLKEKAPTLSS